MLNLQKVLRDEVESFDKEKTLQLADFGAGISNTTFDLYLESKNKNISFFLLDIDQKVIDILNKKIKDDKLNNFIAVWANVEGINNSRLKDLSLDIAIVENLFHFLKNKKSFLLELKRVLKPGGKVFFLDNHKAMGKSVFNQRLITTQKAVEKLFEEAGFLVYPIKEEENFEKDLHKYFFVAENVQKFKINNN